MKADYPRIHPKSEQILTS